MEGRVNYTVVGLFVVVLAAILVVMIVWLTAYTDTQQYNSYLVYVHEDVTGLSVDGPVRFNGVQVGFVKSIHLDEKNPKLVRLLLQIEPYVPITTSTYATLNAQGITGVIYVNLKTSASDAPALEVQPGNPYPVIPAKPSLLMQLSSVLPEVTKDIHNLSASLAQVLNQKNQKAFAGILKNTNNFSKMLSDNSKLIEKNLQTLHGVLKNFDVATKKLPDTLDAVHAASTDLSASVKAIKQTARRGDVVMRHFSNQVLPSAQQAISSFQSAASSVDGFVGQLQQNPSMLVRGKQPAQLGPGETR